jgi:hypothetical protein
MQALLPATRAPRVTASVTLLYLVLHTVSASCITRLDLRHAKIQDTRVFPTLGFMQFPATGARLIPSPVARLPILRLLVHKVASVAWPCLFPLDITAVLLNSTSLTSATGAHLLPCTALRLWMPKAFVAARLLRLGQPKRTVSILVGATRASGRILIMFLALQLVPTVGALASDGIGRGRPLLGLRSRPSFRCLPKHCSWLIFVGWSRWIWYVLLISQRLPVPRLGPLSPSMRRPRLRADGGKSFGGLSTFAWSRFAAVR